MKDIILKKYKAICDKIDAYKDVDKKERNRFILLLGASLIIFNYLMICLHADKNIFNIFPDFPEFTELKPVHVYLPSSEGLLEESRNIPQFADKKRLVQYLFKIVRRGSSRENTAVLIPSELTLRAVWFHETALGAICYIDIEPVIVPEEYKVIKDSEKNFIIAVEKTIKENIPNISSVRVLVRGIKDSVIWERT